MVLPSMKTGDSDTYSESRRRVTLAADEVTRRYHTNPSTTSITGTSQVSILTEPLPTETGTIAYTVTQLLEAHRRMMEAQVQAMSAQAVPPLHKFSGESINTDEGSIDRWVGQFKERARVAGEAMIRNCFS